MRVRVCACENTHCNASVVNFLVIWITVLLLVLLHTSVLTSLVFPQRYCSGGYLSHGLEGIGEKDMDIYLLYDIIEI